MISLVFLQEAALKTFHISDDPNNYYVSEASEFGMYIYSKTCVKRPHKNRQNNDLNDK